MEEYYQRSGIERPDLPPTSEKTRKPRKPRKSQETSASKASEQTAKHRATPVIATSKKSRWDVKPEKVSSGEPEHRPDEECTNIKKPIESSKHRLHGREYDSSSESSSSESSSSESSSSESDSEEEYRRHRHLERKNRRRRSPKKSSKQQIIQVPTKELAAIAIKEAFDRGQYNVRILLE